jgi:hypothetical protein
VAVHDVEQQLSQSRARRAAAQRQVRQGPCHDARVVVVWRPLNQLSREQITAALRYAAHEAVHLPPAVGSSDENPWKELSGMQSFANRWFWCESETGGRGVPVPLASLGKGRGATAIEVRSKFGSVDDGGSLLMKALIGLAGALLLSCIPLCALAQGTGGSMMQGAGSAAEGAAKQAGENAAGQVMQNMGLMSPSASPSAAQSPQAAATSAAEGSPAAAPSTAEMPAAAPSTAEVPAAAPSAAEVPAAAPSAAAQVPAAVPSVPQMPSVPSVPQVPAAPPSPGY